MTRKAFFKSRFSIFFVALFPVVFLCLGVPQLQAGKKSSGLRFKVGIASFAEGEKEKYKLNVLQPYSFSIKTIQQSMASLVYQERLLSWSGKKRVFGGKAIKILGPMILKKFAEADSTQRVAFKTLSPSGRIATRGDTFLTSQGLHWRFTVINRSRRKIDDFSVMGDSWRLVAQKGQAYKKKTREELNNLTQEISNWVVFPKIRPVKARLIKKPVRPAAGVSENAISGRVKKRLRILENLKKEKMISDMEYRNKREEILKDF